MNNYRAWRIGWMGRLTMKPETPHNAELLALQPKGQFSSASKTIGFITMIHAFHGTSVEQSSKTNNIILTPIELVSIVSSFHSPLLLQILPDTYSFWSWSYFVAWTPEQKKAAHQEEALKSPLAWRGTRLYCTIVASQVLNLSMTSQHDLPKPLLTI